MVFCAHNDDQIIGTGGTLKKYSKENKDVNVYIFSYGEGSHPHYQRKVIVEQRVKESTKSNKILGVTQTVYFGLKEGNFTGEVKKKKIDRKIKKIIRKCKPSKIFIHSLDDPHPDHRAVYHILTKIVEEIKFNGEIYCFDVWNVLNFRKRNSPKLVVDISSTFRNKIDAFKVHKSQKLAIWTLMWNVYLKALLNGFNNGVKYAEVFYKIK